MRKILLALISILLLTSGYTQAQEDDTQPSVPQHTNSYTKLVWRTLDIVNDDPNTVLLCLADSAGNTTNLNDIFSKALKGHNFTAYTTSSSFKSMDTAVSFWLDGGIQKKEAEEDEDPKESFEKLENADAPASSPGKYFIMEKWAFVQQINKIVCTIEWIGQCGKDEHGELKPLFIIKYPDMNRLFNKYMLCKPNDDGTHQTCFDFFESRQFSGKIIRVANVADKLADKEDDDK